MWEELSMSVFRRSWKEMKKKPFLGNKVTLFQLKPEIFTHVLLKKGSTKTPAGPKDRFTHFIPHPLGS